VPELKCNCRKRCETFDDSSNLVEFDKQGYVSILPLEWISDDENCPFWIHR